MRTQAIRERGHQNADGRDLASLGRVIETLCGEEQNSAKRDKKFTQFVHTEIRERVRQEAQVYDVFCGGVIDKLGGDEGRNREG